MVATLSETNKSCSIDADVAAINRAREAIPASIENCSHPQPKTRESPLRYVTISPWPTVVFLYKALSLSSGDWRQLLAVQTELLILTGHATSSTLASNPRAPTTRFSSSASSTYQTDHRSRNSAMRRIP